MTRNQLGLGKWKTVMQGVRVIEQGVVRILRKNNLRTM
jgi:hypothetical protein